MLASVREPSREKPKLGLKTIFLLVLGLLILAAFLLMAPDLGAVAEYIASADLFLYSLAFSSVFIGVIFYTAAWYILLKAVDVNLNFTFALTAVWSSVFFNLMIPTASVGGEVARIYVTGRRTGGDYEKISATVFLQRIFCLIPFIAGSTLGFMYLAKYYELPPSLSQGLAAASAAMLASLIVAVALCIKPKAVSSLTRKLGNLLGRRGSNLVSKVEHSIDRFERSLKLLAGKKRNLAISLILSFIFWFFDVLVAYLVFLSLRYSVGLPVVISVYTIGITLQMIPVGIPGMIGVVESAMSALYASTGIPLSLSIAATLMIRIVMLWFEVLVGALFTFTLRGEWV